MDPNFIVIDGKTYNSVNEMPPEVRAKYEQAMRGLQDDDRDGTPDIFEAAMPAPKTVLSGGMKFVVDGREYNRIEDLPPEARARVRIDYRADARSARLEPSLVRLALRNLLMNATLYAPPETPVILRVLDSDEPLALVLEVADLGPGIDESLRGSLFDEGARGAQARVPGYGLGLHVVQRVAQLHGGSVDWTPNEPRGSVFRLLLPQGDPG